MKIAFNSHLNCNIVITTKFCTWHDSCAVMVCAKNCSNLIASNGIAADRRTKFRLYLKYDGKISEQGPWEFRRPGYILHIYDLIIEILEKLVLFWFLFIRMIQSCHIFTCCDDWAVVVFRKLLTDLIMIFHIKATFIFVRFGLWAHKPNVFLLETDMLLAMDK